MPVYAEHLQFACTVVFIYLFTKLSVGSLSHLWLKGLEFCVPPSDEYIEELLNDSPINKKRTKKGRVDPVQQERKPVVLHLAQISSPCLQDHFFFEEFDLLVLTFSTICITIVFHEIWDLVAPLLFPSNSNVVLISSSSIGSVALIIVIFYCLGILFNIIKQAGSESTEMKLSLSTGIVAAILCFFVIGAPESFLNFGLHSGFYDFLTVCKEQYPEYPRYLINFTMFRSVLSVFSGFLSGIAVYPGLRLARCHFLVITSKRKNFMDKFNFFISAISFVFPIFCILSFIDPLMRNTIVNNDDGFFTDEDFESLRLLLLYSTCILRIYLVRTYVQLYLNTSLSFAELFINCTDKRILMVIRDRMYGVYAYLCISCVQLVAPIFLTLLFIIEISSVGGIKIGLLTPLIENSNSIFTASFVRGIFSFLTWWFLSWWFLISLGGFIFERQQYINANK